VSERLLTSRELGELLGFSTAWVQDRFEAGDLPGFRISGRLRFRLSEVELWLETKRPDAEEKLSTTPRTSGRGAVSLTSTTPLQGGEDA
jgi:predicted DNA-binding transcriptional regulator AlpA